MTQPEGTLVPSRVLHDGRVLDVIPLTFNRARLVLSPSADSHFYDNGW